MRQNEISLFLPNTNGKWCYWWGHLLLLFFWPPQWPNWATMGPNMAKYYTISDFLKVKKFWAAVYEFKRKIPSRGAPKMTKFYEYVWFIIDMGGGLFWQNCDLRQFFVDFYVDFHIFVRRIENTAPISTKIFLCTYLGIWYWTRTFRTRNSVQNWPRYPAKGLQIVSKYAIFTSNSHKNGEIWS